MTQLQQASRFRFLPSGKWVRRPVELTPRKKAIRYLCRLAAAFTALMIGSYLFVEAAGLRFCQPWTMQMMHKVRYFQTEVHHPEVVYVGTSQIHNSVMPMVIAEEAQTLGQRIGVQHNLAVPGADVEISWVLARDLLVGEKRPRVLVVGVFPLILSREHRGSEFFPRYGSFTDVADRVWHGEASLSDLGMVSRRGLENLLQLPFYRLRKVLPGYKAEFLAESQGGSWVPRMLDQPAQRTDEEWQRVLTNINRGDLSQMTFGDDTRPARILKQFRDLARERGMELIIVLPPQRLEAAAFYQRYHDWMNDFCQREGIRYLNCNDERAYGRDDFVDPYHLNVRGAMKFSRTLAPHVLQALARSHQADRANPSSSAGVHSE